MCCNLRWQNPPKSFFIGQTRHQHEMFCRAALVGVMICVNDFIDPKKMDLARLHFVALASNHIWSIVESIWMQFEVDFVPNHGCSCIPKPLGEWQRWKRWKRSKRWERAGWWEREGTKRRPKRRPRQKVAKVAKGGTGDEEKSSKRTEGPIGSWACCSKPWHRDLRYSSSWWTWCRWGLWVQIHSSSKERWEESLA